MIGIVLIHFLIAPFMPQVERESFLPFLRYTLWIAKQGWFIKRFLRVFGRATRAQKHAFLSPRPGEWANRTF